MRAFSDGGADVSNDSELSPSSSCSSINSSSRCRRLFLGPMPHGKLLIDNGRADIGSELDDEEFDKLLDGFMERHGLQTFLKLGGRVEDWGEGAARRLKERTRRKWEGSDWVKAIRERKAKGKGKGKAASGMSVGLGMGRGIEWVGTSFDVAEVLGVDLLHGEDGDDRKTPEHSEEDHYVRDAEPQEQGISSPRSSSSEKRPPPTTYDSFVTAPSTLSGMQSNVSLNISSHPIAPENSNVSESTEQHVAPPSSSRTQLTLASVTEGRSHRGFARSRNSSTESFKHSAASSTPLLPYAVSTDNEVKLASYGQIKAAKSDTDVRNVDASYRSILASPGKGKIKGKNVHYDDITAPSVDIMDQGMVLGVESGKTTGDETPASPKSVLSRPADQTGASSAAASAVAVADKQGDIRVGKDGVKFRGMFQEGQSIKLELNFELDRMLVRVFHSSHSNIGKHFDEKDCRVTRGLLSRDWAEFLVIWRRNRIELYEDYVRGRYSECLSTAR